jgi:hypothetical protein
MEINEINEIIKSHPGIGDVSDGYHTFNDLYKMRLALTVALFNEWTRQKINNVHKSTKHSDGELCFGGGWFIVMATVAGKQISFHYEMKHGYLNLIVLLEMTPQQWKFL